MPSADIPGFLRALAKGDFGGALAVIHEENSLPSICGRACPQEVQCESLCILGRQGEPVAIGDLERFVADWGREHRVPQVKQSSRRRLDNRGQVAVVGSGPAGLTAAAELNRLGYGCTIFEALHTLGGVLAYGIPEFRLPKAILADEFQSLMELGVEIRTNVLIGRTLTIEDLFAQGFQAVFLGTGAGLPQFLGIPGEDLNGVYTANEFLTRVNLMKAYHPQWEAAIQPWMPLAPLADWVARSLWFIVAPGSCFLLENKRSSMQKKKELVFGFSHAWWL